MINEFGEDTNSYCSFESKETALLHSENGNLQQRVNVLTHEVRARTGTPGGDGRAGGGDMRDGTMMGRGENKREKYISPYIEGKAYHAKRVFLSLREN